MKTNLFNKNNYITDFFYIIINQNVTYLIYIKYLLLYSYTIFILVYVHFDNFLEM